MKRMKIFLLLCLALVCLAFVSCSLEKPLTATDEKTRPSEETQLSTEEATVTEPEPFEEKIEAEDALVYTKDVIPCNGWSMEYMTWKKHSIVLPRLTGDTENIVAFNQKMYSNYKQICDELALDHEENRLYNIQYEFLRKGDVIGILIVRALGWQLSEFVVSYDPYFYDTASDREISFAESLEKFGLTFDALDAKIRASSAFQEFLGGYDYETLGAPYFRGEFCYCVMSDTAFFAVYTDPDGFYDSEVLIQGTWADGQI